MNRQETLKLRIRSLIADKEMVVAKANHDAKFGDGWRCDYEAWSREISAEINILLSQVCPQGYHDKIRDEEWERCPDCGEILFPLDNVKDQAPAERRLPASACSSWISCR